MNYGEFDESIGINERIESFMPEVIQAVESLELATVDNVLACLEENNIKVTKSEVEMSLALGCKIGAMEERSWFRLNPELRMVLGNNSMAGERSIDSKVGKVASNIESGASDSECCSSAEEKADDCDDSGSEVSSLKRPETDDEDDDEDDDDDDDLQSLYNPAVDDDL